MKTLLYLSLLFLAACSYRVEKEASKVKLDPQTVVFAELQSAVFGPKCARCHGGWAGSYEGVAARIDEIHFRIESSAANTVMPPPGAAPLTVEEKAALLGWISRGAPLVPGEQPAGPPPAPEPEPIPRILSFANVRDQVLAVKCATCHRHKENLVSYEWVKNNQADIASRVRSTLDFDMMPPPGRAPSLSEEEKSLLLDWIQAGAPEFEPET